MVPHHNLNVVAIMRTEASGVQLDKESTDMNGTKVQAHVGLLKDVKPGVEIFQDIDVLLLDVDPNNDGDMDRLQEIVSSPLSRHPGRGDRGRCDHSRRAPDHAGGARRFSAAADHPVRPGCRPQSGRREAQAQGAW